MTLSLEQAAERLREINREIHMRVDGVLVGTPRRLTDAEWLEVVELVVAHDFPCVLVAGGLGPELYIRMTGDTPEEGPDLECLLSLDHGKFPFPSARKGFAGQDETLDTIKPFVYRVRNQELLAWYGLRPLKDSIHDYSY